MESPCGATENKHDRIKADSRVNNSTPVDSTSPVSETRLVDLLDSTLWNRRLAPSSERLVYALVHQIFHGIKEHFLVSTELKVGSCILPYPLFSFLVFLIKFLCHFYGRLILWTCVESHVIVTINSN